MEVNAGLLFETISVLDKPTGGSIGAAAATVDVAASIFVVQNTPGQVLILPNPTDVRPGKIVLVGSSGTATFLLYGALLTNISIVQCVWKGTQWAVSTAPLNAGPFLQVINGAVSRADKAAATSPIATAQAGTAIALGELTFRYSANASNGNLEVRAVGPTALTVWYTANEQFIGTRAQQGAAALAANGNGGAFVAVGNLGAAIREWLTYYISTATNAYIVTLVNHNDTNIHLSVEKLI